MIPQAFSLQNTFCICRLSNKYQPQVTGGSLFHGYNSLRTLRELTLLQNNVGPEGQKWLEAVKVLLEAQQDGAP